MIPVARLINTFKAYPIGTKVMIINHEIYSVNSFAICVFPDNQICSVNLDRLKFIGFIEQGIPGIRTITELED